MPKIVDLPDIANSRTESNLEIGAIGNDLRLPGEPLGNTSSTSMPMTAETMTLLTMKPIALTMSLR